MNTFLLKIILMPSVIAFVTLIARKWGNVIGGVIAGMPWVGGAILFFIGIEQGETFMLHTLSGVLIGLIGWLGFCTTYVIAGQRLSELPSFALGIVMYLLIGSAFYKFTSYLPTSGWFLVMISLTVLSLTLFPKVKRTNNKTPKPLRFEIPLRMIVITAFVFAITYFAELLGPSWSGILTPFPVMTATLALFIHYTQGIAQVRLALTGMYTGVIGFSIFIISIGYFSPIFGFGNSFIIGLALNVFATLLAKQLFSRFKLI